MSGLRERTSRLVSHHATGLRSFIWVSLSAIAFLIAALLTGKIVHVGKVVASLAPGGTVWTDMRARYDFAVFASPGTKTQANVVFDYALGDEQAVLVFSNLPKGTERIRVMDMYVDGCRYRKDARMRWSDAQILQATTESTVANPPEHERHSVAAIDVSSLAFDSDSEQEINCNVVPHPLSETFTTTVSLFYNFSQDPPTLAGQKLIPLPVALRMNNDTGSSEVIAPGSPQDEFSENNIILNPAHYVAIRSRWILNEQRRDIYLVIIGLLVAFGAALFLESLRPFIERIGRPESALEYPTRSEEPVHFIEQGPVSSSAPKPDMNSPTDQIPSEGESIRDEESPEGSGNA